MNVAIRTVGCRTNKADSTALAALLRAEGWVQVDDLEAAQVVLVNSCTVTAQADRDTRHECYKARRAGSNPWVFVFGCYPRAQGREAAWADQRTLLLEQPGDVIRELRALAAAGFEPGGTQEAPLPAAIRTHAGERRCFIKIQEGCDRCCSYCIVPRARGTPRSLPAAEVLAVVVAAVEAGSADVCLTGTHVGQWGRDLHPPSSLDRLLALLSGAALPCLFRIGSLEPQDLDRDAVFSAMQPGGSFCPHLHLPLQSGSDRILSMMGRPYDAASARELITAARCMVGPLLAVGVDVISAFPGETPEAFAETLEFLEAAEIAYLHPFTWSARPGTPAAAMTGRVGHAEALSRTVMLRELSARKKAAFAAGMGGATLRVMLEGVAEPGLLRGLSENYLRCMVRKAAGMPGDWISGRVTDVKGEVLFIEEDSVIIRPERRGAVGFGG